MHLLNIQTPSDRLQTAPAARLASAILSFLAEERLHLTGGRGYFFFFRFNFPSFLVIFLTAVLTVPSSSPGLCQMCGWPPTPPVCEANPVAILWKWPLT